MYFHSQQVSTSNPQSTLSSDYYNDDLICTTKNEAVLKTPLWHVYHREDLDAKLMHIG